MECWRRLSSWITSRRSRREGARGQGDTWASEAKGEARSLSGPEDASTSGGGWRSRVAGGRKMPNSKGNRRPDDWLGIYFSGHGSRSSGIQIGRDGSPSRPFAERDSYLNQPTAGSESTPCPIENRSILSGFRSPLEFLPLIDSASGAFAFPAASRHPLKPRCPYATL